MMKLRKSDLVCPWAYEGPTLTSPPNHRTFSELAKRVQRFSRDGIIGMGSRALWLIWRPNAVQMESQANQILWSTASQMVALGLMYCKAGAGPRPTEREFRQLCWELHQLPKSVGLRSPQYVRETKDIEDRLKGGGGHPRLAKIGAGRAMEVRGLWQLGRTLGGHLKRTRAQFIDLARAGAILDELRRILRGQEDQWAEEYRRAEQAFFRTSPRLLLRTVATMLAYGNCDPLGPLCPGRMDLPANEPRPEFPDDVGVDDLLIASAHFSISLQEYQDLGTTLLELPTERATTHPCLDELQRHPIVHLTDYGDEDDAIAAPSPWSLVSAATRFVLDDFVEHLACNASTAFGGIDVRAVRGKAFENYLTKSLACRPEIRRIAEANTERPDFCWDGERYAVVIEAKVGVQPGSDSAHEAPTSILEGWRRLCKAIDQAQTFIESLPSDTRRERYVLVIVVNEQHGAVFSLFRHAAGRFQLLEDTDLLGVAVWSPAELERVALTQTADVAGRAIERAFIEATPDALDQPPVAPQAGPEVHTPHLRAEWHRFFPELPLPGEPDAERPRDA